jgi:protein SCO1/2
MKESGMRRRLSSVAVILVVAGMIAGCTGRESYQFKGGEIQPPSMAAPLKLTDQYGNPFSLETVKGNVALVYFGYASCPDLCPTTLSDFAVVKDELGTAADRVRFILVTVDPERDTPERMEQYLSFFDPDFIGLWGTEAEIEDAKAGYGAISRKVESTSGAGYLVDHSSLIYLIDREGRLRLTYPYGIDPLSIVEDIRHLL